MFLKIFVSLCFNIIIKHSLKLFYLSNIDALIIGSLELRLDLLFLIPNAILKKNGTNIKV